MKKVINYLVLEKQENSNNYYLRLTAEMQDDIGTVGYVQFKNTDKKDFQKDDVFLALEASKAILTLKMPLDATVVEWNQQIIENPELISSADQNNNWIMILTNIDKKTFDSLEDF
ncbi:glycine cleavage system protein H [Mycoplasma putrefaciens]|uniref:Glycine cleavage system H protein n=1 Tax=Mycoplasma putrefaciens Mput9231 TaxID=1292033 RepID=M9WI35_9MOLU|nr:glycine cleavage system protein H [Mycoplasma putrefaciens]AGJ91024.1 Glycine cleavage system H protein [Mycoplasma putrefaciens Mput9231]